MRNFMIGQYGGYDAKKAARDFRSGFYGMEACLFESDEDAARLVEESKTLGFRIGIHFPLRSGRSKLRDALFLSQDADIRENAYAWIEDELEYLTRVEPDYVLFHYPKPVILDDRVNWEHWRFADSSEFVYESGYDQGDLIAATERLFKWLTEKSEQYRFTPVLEFDALNRYVYADDFLERLLIAYPAIKLCLDTGRLFLQTRVDPHFDAEAVIKRYARYAAVIHLWTLRYTDKVEVHHYPVLPEQRPEDGWAPIGDYLRIIHKENPQVRIQFEHRSDMIGDEDLDRCYRWVDGIWGT